MIFDREDFLSSMETYKHQFLNFIKQEKNVSTAINRMLCVGNP